MEYGMQKITLTKWHECAIYYTLWRFDMKGYLYILECADGSYYRGNTRNLEKRLWGHNNFLGANYTRKKHPVKLVFFEEYSRIDEAFYREKQVQGWSHAKKKALIEANKSKLIELSKNYSQHPREVASTSSATEATSSATDMVSLRPVDLPTGIISISTIDAKISETPVTEHVEVTDGRTQY